MHRSQREEAAILAAQEIDKGADPDSMVHILYYPDNYKECEDSIQGLSTPISYDDWVKGGYTNKYYRLADLAKEIA